MTRIRSITVLLGAAVLAACSKDSVQKIAGPTAGAFIKFYNASVNAPAVNFYANDVKVTAIDAASCEWLTKSADPKCLTTGVEAVTGTAYGAVGNGGLYSSIAPASYTFTGRITAAIDNGLAVSKLTTALGDGKYYSYYQSGFYDPNPNTSDPFLVEDQFPASIDFTVANVRFVNAISNSSPMILYARNTITGAEVAVGGAVAYKGAGTFMTVPGAFYDLNVRTAGSATNVITSTGVSFVAGRVYTVSARGDITVTSATAANRPILNNTANR